MIAATPPNKVTISIEFDVDNLETYTDGHLAALWHLAQANPVPISDKDAGEIADKIGREIVRRWLAQTKPELYHHRRDHYFWSWLIKFAKYDPATDTWVPGRPEGSTAAQEAQG